MAGCGERILNCLPEENAWELSSAPPFFSFVLPAIQGGVGRIPAASGEEGVMTNEKFFELGYRIEEIASSSGKIQGGDDSGWYYGRPDAEGNLSEKVGPFDTYAEAMKHLEEELFADDED